MGATGLVLTLGRGLTELKMTQLHAVCLTILKDGMASGTPQSHELWKLLALNCPQSVVSFSVSL